MSKLSILYRDVGGLIPYARNSRTHSEAQVAQIAASIKEFGWTNPVLIDETGSIIAGHGRVMAARKLGEKTVPTITLEGLTDTQRRAYAIADNKLALNAGWDEEMLALEIEELRDAGFDIDLTGFDSEELSELMESLNDSGAADGGTQYTTKIEAPTYQPSDNKPKIEDLFDDTKAKNLREEIEATELPDEVKRFLRIAADRHTIFDFRKIADYYSHSTAEIQGLMEKSALVIIDFDQAIENGYVQLSKAISDQYLEDGDDD